ncbi:MAG: hypothetical protein JWM91_742 [Rhodospirillales bacterium]|nr:hypothetical protein [Rhodospirillales bacterium]
MSRYDGGWAPYVPVAERRRRALREVAKLNKKGHPVAPVIIEGRAIATTFWGKAWCQNLENYHDFRNRLARGRTYVRNGSVVDLQIAPLSVNALVSGSSIYKISINIASPPQPHWQSICQDCAGCIDSLVELLQGRFPRASWSGFAVKIGACSRGHRKSASPAVVLTSPRCASTSRRCSTA